ncbi:MAG: hypothetical protein PHD37_06625 [Gallionellaceae bacterium]|nr:hypothetical protein [Gallionellaceae bacterium]
MKLLPPAVLRLLGRRPAVRGPSEPRQAKSSTPEPSPKRKPSERAGGALLRRMFNPALRASTPACLLARLENGVEVIYALHVDGRAERVQDVPEDCPLVLSATEDDLRVVLPDTRSHAAGRSQMVRESALFDKLSIVAAGRAVYGTRVARVHEAGSRPNAMSGRRLAPLVALADRLGVRHSGVMPTVSGFVFGEQPDGAIAIAVFFAQVGEGKLKTFITIDPVNPEIHPDSPDNLHAIYASFITQLGLPEATEPAVFSQTEALAGLRGFYAAYPAQDDFMGVPARLAWRGALALSAGLCLAAGGGWWLASEELARIKADTRAARAEADRDTVAAATRITADLPAFRRFMGLSAAPGLAEAEALYLPGGRVESTLTPQAHIHEVFVPVRLRDSGAADAPDARAMSSAVALALPGCERTALEFSGAVDEIRIRFLCPTGDAAAHPFRGQPGV